MEIKNTSFFKDPVADLAWFENWVSKIESVNQRNYQRIKIETGLGKTQIWGVIAEDSSLETLVIFPGARTSPLFWDLDKGLDNLGRKMRIFMVETNGLPNSSDGNSPEIKSLDYGTWAAEILGKLNIEKAFVAGASFGGLICMKLGITNPEKVKAAFLLNPGCLQPFSMKIKNLYFNLLPIISPNPKNVSKFLDKAVLCKPNHALSETAEKLLIDYEVFALKQYKDKTQKPYYMNEQLRQIKVATYLLEGDKDLLFPFQESISNAKNKISDLKDVVVFENVGHGIETFDKAMQYIGSKISEISLNQS